MPVKTARRDARRTVNLMVAFMVCLVVDLPFSREKEISLQQDRRVIGVMREGDFFFQSQNYR